VAREIYGADGVEYTPQAEKQLADLEKRGYGRLPVCIAKTQYSLSDKPELKGAPKGWYLSVREVGLSAGAGFVVPICGSVMLMPGLSREPAALRMDLLDDGRIVGLK
ncbi:MAG: formate--tetrahydrofolate ligase, partial [Candidatus Methanomethylophilus sp.]|nr:formate--tetrahydrofolate ligase [Methanomethylophilus sp.]